MSRLGCWSECGSIATNKEYFWLSSNVKLMFQIKFSGLRKFLHVEGKYGSRPCRAASKVRGDAK